LATADRLPPLDISYEDDPRVVKEAATEDYSLHVAPRTWRLGRLDMTMAWWALATAFFYMYFAAFIALAYGTWNAIIGILLSVVVYSVINTIISRTAAETGLTVALFSRSMFGFIGASLVTLIFAATCIYYLVFEGSVVAVAAKEYIGGPLKLWYAIIIFTTAPLVWRGVRVWLDRLNGVLLPVYVVLLVAVVVWALSSKGYHGFLPDAKALPGTDVPWLQAFTAFMGLYILMMFAMDFARLGRREDQKYHATVTFGWTFYTITLLGNALIGILLVSTFGITFDQLAGQESALPVDIVALTGLLGLALIYVTQTRINTANLYLASTNLQSFFSRAFRLTLPRTIWVIVACIIGYVIMLTNIFSYVLDALNYQGIAIVAWVGVAMAHVLYIRQRRRQALDDMEWRPGHVPAFNPAGILAWAAATAFGLVVKITDTTSGQFWEVAGLIITFLIGFGVYFLLTMVARESWFVLWRPYDPKKEVDDAWEARIRCHRCDKYYVAQEMDRDPTANHQAICAACASGPGYQAAASRESAQHRTSKSGMPAHVHAATSE